MQAQNFAQTFCAPFVNRLCTRRLQSLCTRRTSFVQANKNLGRSWLISKESKPRARVRAAKVIILSEA